MEKKQVSYKNISNLLLLGGSRVLIETALLAQAKGFDIFVFTAKRQLLDVLTDTGDSFKDLLQNNNIQYVTTNDINTCPEFIALIGNESLAIGFGEAWTFSSTIIDQFDGRLIDYMGIPLPRYRGGAHYTWAILAQEKQWGCHFQMINSDTVQGEFDSGEILVSHHYDLLEHFQNPNDFVNYTLSEETKFINHFLDLVLAGDYFELKPINEADSLFFPRLHTLKNGWIDWSWNHDQIRLFIQAFDKPYLGASTYLDGKEHVHLQNCQSVEQVNCDFHPYMSGLITHVSNDGVSIVAGHQLIRIKDVIDTNNSNITQSLKVGQRLFTPQTMIEQSMLDQVSYDVKIEHSPELHSDHLCFRQLSVSDCTLDYLAWLNDEQVNRYLETRWHQQTLSSITTFVAEINKDPQSHLFGMFDNKTNHHIGNIKIGPVNPHHNYADISYFIGDKSYWGKGLATEAIATIVDYAWQTLNLKTIQAGVYSGNVASVKALQKNGFEFQGKILQQLEGLNGREDHLWYSLKNENI